jgi:hypothetical protein
MLASDLRAAARRLAALGLIALLLWLGAYAAATRPVSLRLYDRQFDNSVGHKFAAAMGRAARHDRSVLLMGASSAHDGFDEDLMDAEAAGWSFVNGGTGMGSVFVYEAMTEMLREYRVHPAVLAIGLHPVALSDRQINFNGAGYTDFFDRWHGWDVVAFDDALFRPEDRRELWLNTLWPGHRFSRQTGRLVRHELHALHDRFYWGERLPRPSFEVAPDDLRPRPRYFYSETAPIPGAAAQGVRWYDETTSEWAAPRHLASLRRMLDGALDVSPRVVVILMPEHSLLRERVSARLRAPLVETLEAYRERGLRVLDGSDAVPDELFRDSVHLIGEGRRRFSRQMAPEIVALWPHPAS